MEPGSWGAGIRSEREKDLKENQGGHISYLHTQRDRRATTREGYGKSRFLKGVGDLGLNTKAIGTVMEILKILGIFKVYIFIYFKLDLEKAEDQEIKLPTSIGSSKKQESFRKTSNSALLTMPKPLTVWITINCGKF